jgi:hypothetical protein
MLRSTVMLGMVFFQALAPVPGGISGGPSYTNSSSQQKVQKNPESSRQAPFVVEAAQDTLSSQHDQDNAEHSVKLTSLPPVTLADKAKTLWDYVYEWGPWICNLFLVLVGFLQVMLLRQTRREMSRQARDTREQHRAKLEVLFPPATPTFPETQSQPDADININASFRVTNYGYSEAFKVVAWGHCILTDQPKIAVTLDRRLSIPSVMRKMTNPDDAEGTDAIKITFAPEGRTATFKQRDVDRLLSRTCHMRIVGVIKYVDVYGDAHESPFDFRWVVQDITEGGVRINKSGWINQSSPTS